MRLNKFLARCGVASRRACDALITDGAVVLNGKVVTDHATLVAEHAKVTVNGIRVKPQPPEVVMLHKPRGLTCSRRDEQKKETIYDCFPPKMHHLHHVGRLDRDSEGLLILSNDGDFSQQLTHPKHKVEKEYLVTLHQAVGNEVLDRLLGGVRLSEGQVRFESIQRVSARRVRVVLTQGYKRQVRRMFMTMGMEVRKLVRIRIGALWLEGLEPGEWRTLNPAEIKLLSVNPTIKNPKAYHSTKERKVFQKISGKKSGEELRNGRKKTAELRRRPFKRSTKRQVNRRR